MCAAVDGVGEIAIADVAEAIADGRASGNGSVGAWMPGCSALINDMSEKPVAVESGIRHVGKHSVQVASSGMNIQKKPPCARRCMCEY